MFSSILGRIDRGREGGNKGLPMGFNRLVEYIPGIQQGTYFLVGGETSSGKSSFVDNCFVFNPYDYVMSGETNIKLKIIYYSFEIEKTIKLTKALCRKIYLDTGLLLDVNYILSRGRNRVSDEHYNIVTSYKNYFEPMEDVIDIRDAGTNPTGVWSDVMKHANQHGKWVSTSEHTNDYIPNDPNLYTIIIVDHAGLTKLERGFTKKENIDKLSEYFITLRNKCNFIPVLISQFNRAVSSTERFRLNMVTPQLSDFKDSSNPAEDANIVLSLFSPHRYEIKTYRDYNISLLKDRFRSVNILKNRDGEADKTIGLKFVGEVGHFEEYKKAKEMTDMDYQEIIKLNGGK